MSIRGHAKKGPFSHRGNLITRSLSLSYRVTSRLMHRDDREYASTNSIAQKFRCVSRGYTHFPTKAELCSQTANNSHSLCILIIMRISALIKLAKDYRALMSRS